MRLSELIRRLDTLRILRGDCDVSLMTEITKPTSIQIQDRVTDIAWSEGEGVVIIGQERFDPDWSEQ